jgi:hypothetical protein
MQMKREPPAILPRLGNQHESAGGMVRHFRYRERAAGNMRTQAEDHRKRIKSAADGQDEGPGRDGEGG